MSTPEGHRITTLASGVRVVSERTPAVRSVALGFWIGAGSTHEQEREAGISHLLEHMLFRGSQSYSSEEIDQIFDAMGAECNAGTDKEATSVYTRVLDGHLERAFDVIADMVWRPLVGSPEGVPAGELEAEREVVLEEIAMYEDDPQDRVFDVLGEAVFGEHPLGRAVIGRADVVGALTHEQLRSFHGERYAPADVVIAAAGSIEHDVLVEMAAQRSPDAAGGSGALEPQLPAPSFERRVHFLRRDTEQYHVCLGGRGIARDDERRFALRVLDNVLGGGPSSRLFQEVRERRGLAYSVFTFANQYAATGEVGLYVGTRPENLTQALEVIAAELERFVREPADAQELERSRENAKGRLVLALESTAARMNRLGSSVLCDMPILSVEEIIARIDAVTVEDLQELATDLFRGPSLSVAAIGPDEGVLRKALGPLEAVTA